MTSTKEYKKWLRLVCKEFDLTQKAILGRQNSDYLTCARHTFYWLCFREKIDLYRLSEYLGKHRTTVWAIIRKQNHRNKEIEDKIWNNVKTRRTEETI